eukprot:jgi/Chlat1/7970/Chrsp69S09185
MAKGGGFKLAHELAASAGRAASNKAKSVNSSSASLSLLPEFTVSRERGFLPLRDPVTTLPERYGALEQLLQAMPVRRKDGSPGLLSSGSFGAAVHRDLPLYHIPTQDLTHNPSLAAALYRDYTFAASAYLLEPCDLHRRENVSNMDRIQGGPNMYGLGREVLPANIAVPLAQVADVLKAKPFMEYALSYALYNWKKRKDNNNNNNSIEFDDIDVVRGFHGSDSEAGFVLVHVAMVARSGRLVSSVVDTLRAVECGDVGVANKGMDAVLAVMREINGVMDTMWARSRPEDYNEFRTFILGTHSQPMFPRGVVYEGVSTDPLFFRGESGANDSIVPTLDNLLQLDFPPNPLTNILKEFREYRPSHHSAWLAHVRERADECGVKGFAKMRPETHVRYLALLDQVREFRARHWSFAKEYILKRSAHPVATGGSPIATWLPNQLRTVLEAIEDGLATIDHTGLSSEGRELLESVRRRSEAQIRLLDREVDHYAQRIAQANAAAA